MLEVDKEYIHLNHPNMKRAKVLAILSDGRVLAERNLNAPFMMTDDGLWQEYKKPIKHVRYINVYRDFTSTGYATRKKADESSDSSRVGCVRVELTEGQYDD